MELRVTVQIDGADVYAGKLFQNVRNGNEATTFSCDPAYLESPCAFALAPDMPLVAGPFCWADILLADCKLRCA